MPRPSLEKRKQSGGRSFCSLHLCSRTSVFVEFVPTATNMSSNNDCMSRLKGDAMDAEQSNEASEAATVLTKLGSSLPPEIEVKIDEDDDDFEIPQRFTKSGRKRAVSFPLKVCLDWLCCDCLVRSSPSRDHVLCT